ncbi:MAG: class I SAM-dependent methyltransferase [Acidobacteria bacterium]|nr:class I SAM-dependent methyltransferase [Acidobacteriota bacterium]
MNIREEFGDLDIYLFDQLLKGRIQPAMKILDAGCGKGRNLIYFLRHGYQVFAVDADANAVDAVRKLAAQLAPTLAQENFHVAAVSALPFASEQFDLVISSAVLHFATDEAHFHHMLDEMWRVLKPGGIFFARLASSIGIEAHLQTLGERRYRLPDGSARFLVDAALLHQTSARLQGRWLDPLKTTNVENLRCMTTWVLEKC